MWEARSTVRLYWTIRACSEPMGTIHVESLWGLIINQRIGCDQRLLGPSSVLLQGLEHMLRGAPLWMQPSQFSCGEAYVHPMRVLSTHTLLFK